MEYKRYTNNEVFTWWEPLHHYTGEEILSLMKKYPNKPLRCMTVRDYMEDPMKNSEVELLCTKCQIYNIRKVMGEWEVEFCIGKLPFEMTGHYDIYTENYIMRFRDDISAFYDCGKELSLELKLAVGTKIFMEGFSKKVLQKKEENI